MANLKVNFPARKLLPRPLISPQLAGTRPRFVRELVLVPIDDGLAVEGASHTKILRGKSAQTLIPSLIELMDGTRTIKDLETALPGVPAEHVRTAVSMLYNSGLVEDGNVEANADSIPNLETLGFLRRQISPNKVNRSGIEAYEKLQIAEIVLIGESASESGAASLKSLLERTGLGRVIILPADSLNEWRPHSGVPPSGRLVVSFVIGPEDFQRHERLDDFCSTNQLMWLRVVVDPEHRRASFGPLFVPGEGPCFRCSTQLYARPAEQVSCSQRTSRVDIAFWAGMAASEIVYMLSRVVSPMTGREFREYQLDEWKTTRLRSIRMPGCPRCRPLADIVPRRLLETALVFEDQIALDSKQFSYGSEREPSAQLIRALTRTTKRLPNCRQYLLNRAIPKLDRAMIDVLGEGENDHNVSEPLTLNHLATLLLMTAGMRDSGPGTLRRWAATGGNLGSVELFVAIRNAVGIEPGLYFYQPGEHSLARLETRTREVAVDELMRRSIAEHDRPLPDVMVFFTGSFERVSRKYGAFAYRLINLDAGTAVSQMHVVARTLGLSSRTVPRWADDFVENELHLEKGQEHCTTVVELSARAPLSPAGLTLDKTEPSVAPPSSQKPVEFFRGMTTWDLAAVLYQESRIKEHEVRTQRLEIDDYLCKTARDDFPLRPLPSALHGGRLVSDALGRRMSVRRFGVEPVSVDQLSTMLHRAHFGDQNDWPREHANALPLTFLVLAWNTSGLDPGVYSYEPLSHGLYHLGPPPSPEHARELFIQDEFAEAPLVIWMFGNLGAACARYGAFGHRQLLLRAGAAGNRMWMCGMAMGLAGTLVGGVVAGAARRQFGMDGYHKASLLAFVTGYGAQSIK